MNLNNFESYIDRIIYSRGYDYYENGVKKSPASVESYYKYLIPEF